jgi:hypothetical protein
MPSTHLEVLLKLAELAVLLLQFAKALQDLCKRPE